MLGKPRWQGRTGITSGVPKPLPIIAPSAGNSLSETAAPRLFYATVARCFWHCCASMSDPTVGWSRR